jgi:hypothetical protein
MLKEEYRNILKSYKVEKLGSNVVAGQFPSILCHVCINSYVINMYGQRQTIYYDWKKKIEFEVSLGAAIASEYYDILDDIIINFMKTFNYNIITPANTLVNFIVNIPEPSIAKFQNVCNNFKGKLWDDILNDFIDALYEFTNTITIHGDKPQ